MSYKVQNNMKTDGSVLFGKCSPATRYSPHKKIGAVAAVGFRKERVMLLGMV